MRPLRPNETENENACNDIDSKGHTGLVACEHESKLCDYEAWRTCGETEIITVTPYIQCGARRIERKIRKIDSKKKTN